MPVDPKSVPDFDDLSQVEGMPQGCAWGIFDCDGKKDKVGTLNFLTPDVVKRAAAEVNDGVSISLNWALDGNKHGFRRQPEHKLIHLNDMMPMITGHTHFWDDEITFNTQTSSQWDSLCHTTNSITGLTYNGFQPTSETLATAASSSTANGDAPTLDHWHTAGGMVARGVLLDYKAYTDEKDIPFHPLNTVRITVSDLEACAAHFGVEFNPGDVLLVRTSATEEYEKLHLSDAGVQSKQLGTVAGLHGCEETARWIWNRRFAAVASDSVALEALPGLDKDGNPGGLDCLPMHQYLLTLFGMSIGELWDLKSLSEYCKKSGRYSFMLTSAPLNIPCLIGSPPNALAIF